MMRKIGQKIRVISLFIVILGSILVGTGYYYVFYPNTRVQDEGIIHVWPQQTAIQVLDSLRIKGYIKNSSTLLAVAKLKKYISSAKSGKYRIRAGMNNNELINMLRSGDQIPVQCTFNNIRTLPELVEVISKQLSFSAGELYALLNDTTQLASLGFTPATILALFIPNTYEMYWNISAQDFLKRMQKEYQRFWNTRRLQKAQALNLKPVEIITLASIIEEETTKREEYPIIAGVYLNRLERGIKLDACPTLKFAWGDFSINRILDCHLAIDSPYNTYKYAGLPPGPIRVASIQVIDGVLNRQKHDYLYFCAKNDFSGYHHFSRTLRQHNAYARAYHQELNRRKIWK